MMWILSSLSCSLKAGIWLATLTGADLQSAVPAELGAQVQSYVQAYRQARLEIYNRREYDLVVLHGNPETPYDVEAARTETLERRRELAVASRAGSCV